MLFSSHIWTVDLERFSHYEFLLFTSSHSFYPLNEPTNQPTHPKKPLNLTPQIENPEENDSLNRSINSVTVLFFLLYKWRFINCQKCQNTFTSHLFISFPLLGLLYKLRKSYQLITLILQRQFNIKSTLKATNHNLKGFFVETFGLSALGMSDWGYRFILFLIGFRRCSFCWWSFFFFTAIYSVDGWFEVTWGWMEYLVFVVAKGRGWKGRGRITVGSNVVMKGFSLWHSKEPSSGLTASWTLPL